MKNLFKRIARWILRDELRRTREADDECMDDLCKDVLLAEQQTEAMRALLEQLRVRQTNVEGRTGWAVQAFIPEEVVKKLHRNPDKIGAFTQKVSDVLVTQALKGIIKVTQPGNRVCAITFGLLGKQPLIEAWNENQKRPTIFKQLPDGSRKEMRDLPGQATRNVFKRIEDRAAKRKQLHDGKP